MLEKMKKERAKPHPDRLWRQKRVRRFYNRADTQIAVALLIFFNFIVSRKRLDCVPRAV